MVRLRLQTGAKSWKIGCIALLTLGCARASEQPTTIASSSGAEETIAAPVAIEVKESSVRPNVNAPYFEPNALDRYIPILEAERREVFRRRVEIVEAIGLREGMRAADIGAGTGVFTGEIAKRVGASGTVFAVDIAPDFLDRLRERVETEGLRNVTVVEGKERATGLASSSIDLAFMCSTYHHLEYPRTYMRSVLRALRPGGVLVLVDFERIEGETSLALLRHVRAGKETVVAEVQDAGFSFEEETELLETNFFLRFRRPP